MWVVRSDFNGVMNDQSTSKSLDGINSSFQPLRRQIVRSRGLYLLIDSLKAMIRYGLIPVTRLFSVHSDLLEMASANEHIISIAAMPEK